jgi:uncharacterized repeat protein (TIGR01451 family)
MRIFTKNYTQLTARMSLLCLLLFLAFATSAIAQNVTELNVPTVTKLWGGTANYADPNIGLSSFTNPASGLILPGTAPSQYTNGPKGTDGLFACQEPGATTPCNPEYHMWYGDASNGFCRVDPEIDFPRIDPDPVNNPGEKVGIGLFNNIITTCVGNIQAGAFAPMQASFDATTNTIYAADIPRTANGVIRLHYIPAGDNGHGTIDPIHVVSLMGNDTARNGAGGCPVVTDPRISAATPFTMTSAAVGPDGNVYVGWARNGSITRIPHPATFDPSNDADCASIQVVGFAPDARFGNGGAAGHTFGLAWIGHTIFGADNIAPWFKDNWDQCMTPANGNQLCGPTSADGAGTEILGAFVPGPQAGIVSDFTYNGPNTTFPGNTLYAMTLSGAARVINVTDVTNIGITPQFGGTFCFLTGGTVDTRNLANETFYAGIDCTQGAINGAAAVYRVTPQPPAGAPPAIPTSVTASNATPPGNTTVGTANVNWIPGQNGQATSGYLVRTVLASDGVTCVFPSQANPLACVDQTVSSLSNGSLPNAVSVTNLPLNVTVEFLVASQNSFGTSQFSAPSAPFTAFVPVAPGPPTGVVASSGNKSAQVAWTAPSNNGGLPITSYTVTAQLCSGNPIVCSAAATMSVAAPATGVNFTGLTNGSTYNFIVQAVNAAGTGNPSLASNSVQPVAPLIEDIAVTMSAPTSVNAGSFVTFTIGVTNLGPGDVPNVTLADSLPANFVSATTTQGACGVSGSQFNCTFGGMPAGDSIQVKVTVAIGSSAITNSATATLKDLQGNSLNAQDPNLNNNTASASVGINSGSNNVTADIQVTGSNNNGGPAVGQSVLFTWQIKNNTGNATAPNVSFETTLPASFQYVNGSLNTSIGGCTPPPAGLGGSLSCSATSLPGGQTMIVTYSVSGTQAGTFTTTGKATSGANDSNPNNNTFPVNMQPK